MAPSESITEKQQYIYSIAKSYLKDNAPVRGNDLSVYFDIQRTYSTKNEILYQLLSSLQNKQMMSKVIGFEDSNKQATFRQLLFEYDAVAILAAYATDSDLFMQFDNSFTIKNKDSKGNSWRRYAKSVLSACAFIERFVNADDFAAYVEKELHCDLSTDILVDKIAKEVYGLGFPLACDFLKELGYWQYSKPDVHIINIFTALGLCVDNEYAAYCAVRDMARAVNETPFNVDRLFWLIGSGNFYKHKGAKATDIDKWEFVKILQEGDRQ